LAELERKFLERVSQNSRTKSGSKSVKEGKSSVDEDSHIQSVTPWISANTNVTDDSTKTSKDTPRPPFPSQSSTNSTVNHSNHFNAAQSIKVISILS
jgi:hypothetical protein